MKIIYSLIIFSLLIITTTDITYAQTGVPCVNNGGGWVCQANPGWSCDNSATPQCVNPNPGQQGTQTSFGWVPTNGTEIHTQVTGDAFLGTAGNWFSPTQGTGQVLGAMAMLYKSKPASTAESIAMLKESITGVKPAYAQGYGFVALSPISQLWQFSRNLALGGFVIIIVVIGIMIMLRSKIDPRTVVTIQQSLPKIALCLVLVLFSYSIIGFMIDGINIITRIGISTLQQGGYLAVSGAAGGPTSEGKIDTLVNANIFQLFQDLYNVDVLIANLSAVDDQFNTIATVLKLDIGILGGSITRLVLWIAVFISVLRTFFMLLTSYLSVTLSIIFAPFKFLFMAIPGSSSTFGDWFRGILANLLVFPAVLFMLAFAAIFVTRPGSLTYYQNPTGTQLWGVEQITFSVDTPYWAPPGLGNWYNMVGPLLALAIILTTPRTLNIIREIIQPKARPSAAEGAASETLQRAAARIPMLGSFTKA